MYIDLPITIKKIKTYNIHIPGDGGSFPGDSSGNGGGSGNQFPGGTDTGKWRRPRSAPGWSPDARTDDDHIHRSKRQAIEKFNDEGMNGNEDGDTMILPGRFDNKTFANFTLYNLQVYSTSQLKQLDLDAACG